MLKIEKNPEFLAKNSVELRSKLNGGKPIIIKGNPLKQFWFWINIFITLMGAISRWFNPIIPLGIALFIYIGVKKTVLIIHPEGFLIRTWIFRVYCQKWKNLNDPPISKHVTYAEWESWRLLIFPCTWGVKKIRKSSLNAWGLRSLPTVFFNFDVSILNLKDMNKNKKKLEFFGKIISDLSKPYQ